MRVGLVVNPAMRGFFANSSIGARAAPSAKIFSLSRLGDDGFMQVLSRFERSSVSQFAQPKRRQAPTGPTTLVRLFFQHRHTRGCPPLEDLVFAVAERLPRVLLPPPPPP